MESKVSFNDPLVVDGLHKINTYLKVRLSGQGFCFHPTSTQKNTMGIFLGILFALKLCVLPTFLNFSSQDEKKIDFLFELFYFQEQTRN
jgi:hypothetical protein